MFQTYNALHFQVGNFFSFHCVYVEWNRSKFLIFEQKMRGVQSFWQTTICAFFRIVQSFLTSFKALSNRSKFIAFKVFEVPSYNYKKRSGVFQLVIVCGITIWVLDNRLAEVYSKHLGCNSTYFSFHADCRPVFSNKVTEF